MEAIFILLAISVPNFYLVGLVEFLRTIFGGKKAKIVPQESSEKEVLSEVAIAMGVNDVEKAKRILASKGYDFQDAMPESISTEPEVTKKRESWFENWYADNSIDLLLYIGAFLIIVSAGTFVGFNWQSFSGEIKAFLLVVLTIAFYGAGFYLYLLTIKVKRAGMTFIAIGSLLIPFNGWAWYNFVLRPFVGFEVVWFFTSLVGLVVWAFLAVFIKKRFFTYLAALGFFSVTESLVAISHLQNEFYSLAAIVSGFVFIGAHLMTRQFADREEFEMPLFVMSYLSVPVAIITGFLNPFLGTGKFFTPFMTVNLFLLALFFWVTYAIRPRKEEFSTLIASYIFILVGLFSFVQAARIELVPALYLFMVASIGFTGISLLLNRLNLKQEAQGTFGVSLTAAIGVYLAGEISKTPANYVHLILAGLLIVIVLWVGYFNFRERNILFFKNFGWFLALWPFLEYAQIRLSFYPYYFVTTATIVYLASLVVATKHKLASTYRESGLGVSLLVAIGSILLAFAGYTYEKSFAMNAIITAYFVGLLFALDAARFKKLNTAILSSAIIVGTFMFNLYYLELENIQFYVLPLALYIFGLGYVARYKKSDSDQLIDIAAGAVLILPTFVQSLEQINGYLYAFLLGFEGFILVILAISLRRLTYRYVGIAGIVLAILSQTYEYLTSLPRWLITGFAGLLFLGLAIYLLASRKEK